MRARVKGSRGRRRLFVFAVVAVLLATLAWYVHTYVSLEEVADQERRIRDYIALHPWFSFLVGFTIYSGLALVPGTGGKAMVYGWLFGFWQALSIVTVGLTLAALAIFSALGRKKCSIGGANGSMGTSRPQTRVTGASR